MTQLLGFSRGFLKLLTKTVNTN